MADDAAHSLVDLAADGYVVASKTPAVLGRIASQRLADLLTEAALPGQNLECYSMFVKVFPDLHLRPVADVQGVIAARRPGSMAVGTSVLAVVPSNGGGRLLLARFSSVSGNHQQAVRCTHADQGKQRKSFCKARPIHGHPSGIVAQPFQGPQVLLECLWLEIARAVEPGRKAHLSGEVAKDGVSLVIARH